MAVDVRGVRLEERLKIKIGEAKNLPARSHGITQRDTYCVLSLDQEEIFRTSIIERTLNPFFGEEFQFEVPRGFRYLSIYMYDRDRQGKQEKVLGKVAIRREELKKYDVDNWFALGPVDADSEVQGKAHIEILYGASLPKNFQSEDDSPMDSRNPCSDSDSAPTADEPAYYSLSSDRKNSRHASRNFMKFGSCSSTSSKKYFTYAAVNENVITLERSESLRNAQMTVDQPIYYTCGGASSSKSMKMSMNYDTFTHQKPRSESCDYHPMAGSEISGTVGSIDGDYLSTELFPVEGTNYYLEQFPTSAGNLQNVEQCDVKNKLSIKVLECSELTRKNGQCDPYAEVTVYYKSGKKMSKKTKARKKTVNPKFDECFMFDLLLNCAMKEKDFSSNKDMLSPGQLEDSIVEVVVSLWHETFFLGEVRVPLQTPDQRAVLNTSAWYFLGSRHGQQSSSNYQQGPNSEYQIVPGATPSGTQFSSVTPASLGHLRLLLRHTVDRVLPSPSYDDLRSLLLKSPPKPITSSAVYILGEIISSKTDIAQPLVRLFMHAELLIPTIRALADAELSTLTDSTTIFRGNTLVSKMMDEAMKLNGLSYLQQTLRPIIELVLTEKKPCEIDPTRIKDAGTIETNLMNLKDYVVKIFTAITQSFVHCPAIMCRLFDTLRQCAAQKFPNDPGVRYSVVSGFIFLRFFAPAILGPKLFDLTTKPIDPQTNRTLTLISKMIQTLGNLVSARSSQQHCKEEYMAALHKSFCEDKHVQEIKQFLEIISTSTDTQNSNLQDPLVLLKEGVMIKKAQRKKRFLRANIKKRYFQLTSCELSYSKARGKKAVCTIPLAEIVAVEPVAEVQNLNMNNMFQIVYKAYNVQRALYIQANNCVERKEWLDLLGKLCEGHRAGPKQYHPSSYLHGHWACCLSAREDAPGCATITARSPPAGIHLRLDPSRDLQRIHCLLYKNMTAIEQLKLDNANTASRGLLIEDPVSYINTLKELIRVTYSLEDRHRAYQRSLDRETKYGSKQAPIGDDNYLHLANMDHNRSPMKHSQSVNDKGFMDFSSSTINQSRMTKSIPLPLPTLSPKSLSRHSKGMKPPMQLQSPPKLYSSNDSGSIKRCEPSFIQQNKGSLTKLTENIDAYLNNSLYIGSSNESIKAVGRSPTEVVHERPPGNKPESGYLKMLSVKNDCDIFDPSSNTLNKHIKSNIEKMKNSKSFSSSRGVSSSEYIQVRPYTVEKENIFNTNSTLPNEKLQRKNIDDAENCNSQEYDFLTDFSSYSKNKSKANECPSTSDDIPPVIPPRGHTSNTPSFTRYYKKPQVGCRNKDVQIRNTTDYEHKSLEQYQIKPVIGEASKTSNFNSNDTTADNESQVNTQNFDIQLKQQPFVASQETRSQSDVVRSLTDTNNDRCENSTPTPSYSLREELDSIPPSKSGVSLEHVIEPDIVLRQEKGRLESKEDRFFSRKNSQRKSIPTKLKNTSKKSNSVDGVPSLDSGSSQTSKAQPPLTDRLTPSFLKKKPKVNTDNVCLPIC